MGVRCIELPGIGTKYELETEKGDRVAIIFMGSRKFQLYILEKGKGSPSAAELNASEARRLGSLLSGAIIEAEKEAVEIAFSTLSDLRIRVHTYVIRKNLAGRSIAELQVRTKTGATVVAVSRKGKNIINPLPSFTFEDGDIVVAIGDTDQLEEFERQILGELMEEIALALFICLILAFVSKRYSLPPIPFYIIAGIAIGKSGLSIVPADTYSQYLSYLGLIFLLFYVGLEMRPKSLRERGRTILLSGVIDLNVNLLIGFAAALLLGFRPLESFILASAFYISSSAMAISSLVENRRLILPEAETIVWMMVFEDVLLILLISLFSAQAENPLTFILLTVAVLAATILIVRILRRPIKAILMRTDDLPSLLTFTAVISSTYLAKLLKIPDALVAIILGSSLAATSGAALDRLSQPFREVFLVLFFVFFGITIDFSGGFSPVVASVLCVLAIGSKMVSGILVGWGLHGSALSGIEIGANTLGRGEFSIALAAIFGSATISATVAILVVATSLAGSFAARYSEGLKGWVGLEKKGARPIPVPEGQVE